MDTQTDIQPAENAVVTEAKPKGRLAEKLSGIDKFKEKSYDNEDDAVSDALSYIEELSENSKQADEFKQNFMQVIEDNPMLAYIINNIKETGSLQVSLQSLFDKPEDMLLREGDEGYDQVQELVNKRVQQELADKAIVQKHEQNMANFPEKLDKWAEAKNIDEAEKVNFSDFIGEFMVKIVTGDVEDEELNKLWDSYKYKSDVSDLQEDLGISNANAAPKTAKQGDILPIPQSTTPAAKPAPEPSQQKIDPLTEIYNNQIKNKK